MLSYEEPTELEELYDDFVYFLIESLADPEDALFNVTEQPSRITIQIDVPEDQKGGLIGKGGRTVRAMRTLLSIAPFKDERPVLLNILD